MSISMRSDVKHGLCKAAMHCILVQRLNLRSMHTVTAALTALLLAARAAFACCVLSLCKPQVCQAQPKYIMQHALLISGITASCGVAGSCKASWLKLMVMPRYDVSLCGPMRSV